MVRKCAYSLSWRRNGGRAVFNCHACQIVDGLSSFFPQSHSVSVVVDYSMASRQAGTLSYNVIAAVKTDHIVNGHQISIKPAFSMTTTITPDYSSICDSVPLAWSFILSGHCTYLLTTCSLTSAQSWHCNWCYVREQRTNHGRIRWQDIWNMSLYKNFLMMIIIVVVVRFNEPSHHLPN